MDHWCEPPVWNEYVLYTIYKLLDAHHVEIEFCKKVTSHHVPAHLQAFVPGMCAILVELPAAERTWFTSYAEKVLATSVTAKLTVVLSPLFGYFAVALSKS